MNHFYNSKIEFILKQILPVCDNKTINPSKIEYARQNGWLTCKKKENHSLIYCIVKRGLSRKSWNLET